MHREDDSASSISSVTLNDKIASDIINQEHTIDTLIDIYRSNPLDLSVLHRVLLFNKISNLYIKELDTLR